MNNRQGANRKPKTLEGDVYQERPIDGEAWDRQGFEEGYVDEEYYDGYYDEANIQEYEQGQSGKTIQYRRPSVLKSVVKSDAFHMVVEHFPYRIVTFFLAFMFLAYAAGVDPISTVLSMGIVNGQQVHMDNSILAVLSIVIFALSVINLFSGYFTDRFRDWLLSKI